MCEYDVTNTTKFKYSLVKIANQLLQIAQQTVLHVNSILRYIITELFLSFSRERKITKASRPIFSAAYLYNR